MSNNTLDPLVESLLGARAGLLAMLGNLSNSEIEALVTHLKGQADSCWYKDIERSLALADLIMLIGTLRRNFGHVALGLMARGNALGVKAERLQEAWDVLGQAGMLYRLLGDDVGWARTRIMRLAICVDLDRYAEGLRESTEADSIFLREGETEFRLRLLINRGVAQNYAGQYEQALRTLNQAESVRQTIDRPDPRHRARIMHNSGLAYQAQGNLDRAHQYYAQARQESEQTGDLNAAAIAELNIALILIARGQYRQALEALHRVLEKIALSGAETATRESIVECYLRLGRMAEARDLARQVASEFGAKGHRSLASRALIKLAIAEAALGELTAASTHLDEAQSAFSELGIVSYNGLIDLHRVRIQLRQGDLEGAATSALRAIAAVNREQDSVTYGQAMAAWGQVALGGNRLPEAEQAGRMALETARQVALPALRYDAHLLLGETAERAARRLAALRHYRAATATVSRLQRGLTVTLKPSFLQSTATALRRALSLHLDAVDDPRERRCAFEALEQAKAQVLHGYLAHKEQLGWASQDEVSRRYIEELDRLRGEHQWFSRLLEATPNNPAEARQRPRLLAEITSRERRMKHLTERLHLRGAESGAMETGGLPSLEQIQAALAPGELLLAYYNDSRRLWVVALDTHDLSISPLPRSADQVSRAVIRLQGNFESALAAPADSDLRDLADVALHDLYRALLGPLEERLRGCRRLYIVPFGELHYLPFHLLRRTPTGVGAYLLQEHEVVILPAAASLTRRPRPAHSGALVLAESWAGKLPNALREGRLVAQLLGVEARCEAQATQAALFGPPGHILHVACHGEFRIDQPGFSYIQLGDGPVFTDDLLRHDLSYGLVTVTACEAGRAQLLGGEDLAGIGRGMLYAGAGALITSFWRVDDAITVSIMETLYRSVLGGASKAAALQQAQRQALAEHPDLHPVYAGAFQLVGDPSPLFQPETDRSTTILSRRTEPQNVNIGGNDG